MAYKSSGECPSVPLFLPPHSPSNTFDRRPLSKLLRPYCKQHYLNKRLLDITFTLTPYISHNGRLSLS